MRAILQYGPRKVGLAELPDPTPGPGEVLLRTRAVTICASDVHLFAEGNVGGVSWDRPFVPGHEVSAVVEDPGGAGLARGTPVVVDPAIPCRDCDRCIAGDYHLCRHLKFMDLPPVDGGMRELVAWPADRVFPLPPELDPAAGALVEPLAVALHAVELAGEVMARTVAVVGCGAIGLLALQVARVRGAARVFAIDPLPERLALARAFGADMTAEVGKEDPVRAVAQETEGRGADIAFEAAGPPEAVETAARLVRPGGTVAVIGIPSQDEYRIRASEVRRKELTLQFVRRQNENYPAAIALVRAGRVKLEPLLTHRFPPERAQEAFELAESRGDGAVRVAVVFP